MKIVLCGTQSPVNVGMILRSAEAFGFDVVYVDTFRTLDKQGAMQTISDFACGAYERRPPEIWSEYNDLENLAGRIIATTPASRERTTSGFEWCQDDVLLIGNEYDGVPSLLETRANLLLNIPMSRSHKPKTPSHTPIDTERVSQIVNPNAPALNVAVAASILMSLAFSASLVSV